MHILEILMISYSNFKMIVEDTMDRLAFEMEEFKEF